MPAECIANPLQRQLADSIIRMQPLDEIRILLATGAKPNLPVTQSLRPLHYAVWQKYADAAQLLLVRGADINATDECGYSALHLAAEHGFLDLVKLLLKHGAKVDYRPDTGELFPRYYFRVYRSCSSHKKVLIYYFQNIMLIQLRFCFSFTNKSLTNNTS